MVIYGHCDIFCVLLYVDVCVLSRLGLWLLILMDAIHDDDKGCDESLINMGMHHNQEGVLVKQHIPNSKFAFYLQHSKQNQSQPTTL